MRGIDRLDGETRVVGVIGWPVTHSLSPPMQNAAIAELGLNWVYVPFAVPPHEVVGALAGMRALGVLGLNATVPHKGAVAELVDEPDQAVRVLGAANTVVNRDGTLFGHNTDGEGFLRSLREARVDPHGKRVALIGAGGSARSVAYAMASDGAQEVFVINRTPDRAVDLAELIGPHVPCDIRPVALDAPEAEQAIRKADIVIDSTPCGMYPNCDEPPVIPGEWLHADHVVCDLVYTPQDTTLLQAARRQGARTLEGAGMLVHQGAIALERWTGREAPVATMRQALLGALAARRRA